MSYPVLFTLSLDSQCGISLSTLTSNSSYSHYDAPAVTFPLFTRFWPLPAILDPNKSPIYSDRRKKWRKSGIPEAIYILRGQIWPVVELFLAISQKGPVKYFFKWWNCSFLGIFQYKISKTKFTKILGWILFGRGVCLITQKFIYVETMHKSMWLRLQQYFDQISLRSFLLAPTCALRRQRWPMTSQGWSGLLLSDGKLPGINHQGGQTTNWLFWRQPISCSIFPGGLRAVWPGWDLGN